MAMEIQIAIDYLPDRPESVSVDEVGNQIEIGLPALELYLYTATAKALRDALIEELGAPEGYYSRNDAAEKVTGLDVQTALDETIPDDKEAAYRQGYADAIRDASDALANK